MTLRSQSWRDLSACATLDSSVFLVKAGHPTPAVNESRRICWQCPVLVDCMDDAVADPFDWASVHVRAGLTPSDRRRIRIRREATKNLPHEPRPIEQVLVHG